MIRKLLLTVLVTLLAFQNQASADNAFKNYQLIIDGKVFELNLDEDIEVITGNGAKSMVRIVEKPFSEYTDDFIAFHHKSGLSVSSHHLGNGITQLMTATATGTVVLVQEYTSIDPSSLTRLMLNEVTKESVQYGYQLTDSPHSRSLKSGETMNGLKATLSYRDEETYVEVLAYGKKDVGVLVITQIDKSYLDSDREVLSRFWDTFQLKF
ncbi:MAG: hypothetical protein OQK12_13255 [Motiliproteus sp.]|nr:hypothetical protein [Motiliproteus sp.]MCW9054129.1 hypothetical protein [Motiliproteus sp.]